MSELARLCLAYSIDEGSDSFSKSVDDVARRRGPDSSVVFAVLC